MPDIRRLVIEAGAVRAGVVTLGPVDSHAEELYREWLAEGRHGEMGYLEKYAEVRHDPRLLLEGARSMIVAAFNYYCGEPEMSQPLKWARYAVGRDYHEGGEGAARAGGRGHHRRHGCAMSRDGRHGSTARTLLGRKGRSGFSRHQQSAHSARSGLMVCARRNYYNTRARTRRARHTRLSRLHALREGLSGPRARRTRRHGCPQVYELPVDRKKYHEDDEAIMPRLGDRIYGCDICQEVCPHNSCAMATEIDNFRPWPSVIGLTREDILGMEQSEFSRIFTHSAIKRAKLAGLQRNARAAGEGEAATRPE